MRRLLLLLWLLMLGALTAFAVPAKRERCTLTLSDGSTIEATWTGDEWLHYYQTDDGRCLQCDDEGIAYFIDINNFQSRRLRGKGQGTRSKRNAIRRRAQGAMTGQKRGLVILVQFPDMPFNYTRKDFELLFNAEGYTDEVNIGSVRDYYLDASYGQFDFSFDVVGPVMMKDSLYRYGGNNAHGDDAHPATMVCEALHAIDDKVDFSQYDWDGDGEVEQVFFIHSGFDEAQSRARNDIWSHAWSLSEAFEEEGDGEGAVMVDGVIIDSYATGAELRGRTGASLTGIGTACHEFAHCFGLPDFYDTVGSNFGMNTWDLMDQGEYNGSGGTPAGFTSYERMFCGWLKPIELTDPLRVKDMPELTSEPVAYIIRNSGKADEYFLLENRQLESWDTALGGHGMLILHVDYDSTAWAENTVNTLRTHQRMTIMPADNLLYTRTLTGDPWPGTSGNTEFSDTSSPAATLFNKNAEGDKLLHHSLSEIAESSDGRISFVFDEEALSNPSPLPASPKGEENVYDLQGCIYETLPLGGAGRGHGIYITNNKKILLR